MAHAETVVEVVAEAEADVGENRGSSGGVDSDGGGNVCVGGSGGNGGWQWQRQPKQGHDIGVVQQRGWWQRRQEQWQQGWRASNGNVAGLSASS
jgi:hypothetical protein